jgi:hypothetical protein
MVASFVSESALTDVFIPNSQKMPNLAIANDPDEHFLSHCSVKFILCSLVLNHNFACKDVCTSILLQEVNIIWTQSRYVPSLEQY